MNKRILLTTGAAVLALAAVCGIQKANAVTANGTIDAVIVAPIVLTAVNNLDFGLLSSSAALGTSVVTTAGVRTVTGGVAAQGGTPNQGTFNLSGDIGYAANISVVGGTATITSGANTMTVNTFTLDYNGSGSTANPLNGVTLTAAASTLNVGATLNVAATQAAGAYTGTFTVDVSYQ